MAKILGRYARFSGQGGSFNETNKKKKGEFKERPAEIAPRERTNVRVKISRDHKTATTFDFSQSRQIDSDSSLHETRHQGFSPPREEGKGTEMTPNFAQIR